MKIINLFGEPSVGKSTTAAGLFYLMKHNQYSVELVTEYAKKLVWEGRKMTLDDQLYITAKQNHDLEILRGQVDYVITDSPILLGILYARGATNKFPSYHNVVKEVFNSYDNVNFLLRRVNPYVQTGRIQTEEQAKEVRSELKRILMHENVQYYELDGDNNAPAKIFSHLTNKSNPF